MLWKKLFKTKDNNDTNTEIFREIQQKPLPAHIAIIMDGNGRWANKIGKPRVFGHSQGVKTLKEIVKDSSNIGIKVLTVYAFSTENWRRPQTEVDFLMNLFSDYLDSEIEELNENNVKLKFMGIIKDLSQTLQDKIKHAEIKTEKNTGLILNLAVNYGGRSEITLAAKKIAAKVKNNELSVDDINEQIINDHLYTSDLPDPDLLIRPSGDFRISNFLLWQLAYTEFWFSNVNWPDFSREHLIEAIKDFQKRDRRFGGIKTQVQK
ncbi:isoprenyl transferase [Selenomonadales bacterium OttesenSCG-928-I06]|nr:isoprenyl transferase [Selenomonadales bacterium OttesenSCG-928-I06]